MTRLIVVAAMLASGCGAEWFGAPAARAPVRYAPAQLVGPPIDLSGPVTMAQLEDLAVERRTPVGSIAARDLRWEVAKAYAVLVARTAGVADISESIGEVSRIDDALRARIAQGTARPTDATRTGLWIAEWRAEATSIELHRQVQVDELNRSMFRRTVDAVIGPPAVVGGVRIVATRDDLLRDAMREQDSSVRPIIAAVLDARLRVVADATASLQANELVTVPAAAALLSQQTNAYETGQATLTDVELAVRELYRMRQLRWELIEWVYYAVANVERIVGHTVPVAPIEAPATSAGSGLGRPVTTAP